MQTTKVTKTLTPAGFAPAGKLSHTYRGILPALTLCVATAAWSQIPPGFRAPHKPPNISMPGPLANAAAATVAVEDAASSNYKFITIDANGSTNAVASSINDERLVTGYYEDSNSAYHGFVWKNGVFRTVDYPGAANTSLGQVNNHGVAMANYGNGTTTGHSALYSVESRTWTALPDVPGYSFTDGYGLNDAGVAVGNAFQGSTSVAWIWDPTTRSYSFFTVPGADQYSTSPSGLNDKGQIAGYFSVNGLYQSFLKEYGTYTIVNFPQAVETFFDGMNNSGIVQGQIYATDSSPAEGFIATSGGVFTTVNNPDGANTALVGINDQGDVCGSYWNVFTGGIFQAFVAFRSE